MRLNRYVCVNLGECNCGNKERSLDSLDRISIRLYTLKRQLCNGFLSINNVCIVFTLQVA